MQQDQQHEEAPNAAAHAELHVCACQHVVAGVPPGGHVRRRLSLLQESQMRLHSEVLGKAN